MIRYIGTMLPSEIYNPYGAVQLPPQEQINYLRAAGQYPIAEQFRNGLVTVQESTRLVDDLELGKWLREGRK